jgi:hypothetical protein
MVVTHFKTVIAAMTFMALAVILAVLFVHADIYPAIHTFGFSVGTDSHYCSIELVRSHLALSCESAG